MYSPLDCMRSAQETFAERQLVYGDNYLRFGKVMEALFPDGFQISKADDWNRFGILVQEISKLTRYCNNFQEGHIDSQHDLGVYAFMLESLDQKAEAKRNAEYVVEEMQSWSE